MEFLIGLIGIATVFSVYKFMSKVKATATLPENIYKHPVEPEPINHVEKIDNI